MRVLEYLLMLLLGGFIAGFFIFITHVPKPEQKAPFKTDAIVVLTGGAGRVDEGALLLKFNQAKVLYISGVHGSVTKAALFENIDLPKNLLDCCVTLDARATNTYGNAVETAQWAADNNIRSIRLVTASYHMPRSLLEFTDTLPKVAILPHPVTPEGFTIRGWWKDVPTMKVLAREYLKYLESVWRLL